MNPIFHVIDGADTIAHSFLWALNNTGSYSVHINDIFETLKVVGMFFSA